MANKIPLSLYLFTRLHQLGICSLHGVPGDYNLAALDYVKEAGLKWIGNCNELNAGYAADGYARIAGMGAVFTVIGVGELSAINACAGSFAESIPVVYIVGVPTRSAQSFKLPLHHTLGDGNFDVFADMFTKITVAQTHLNDAFAATKEIDRVLETCWRKRKPVYVRLPADMAVKMVHAAPLENKMCLNALDLRGDEVVESKAVEKTMALLKDADRVVVLVDGNVLRYQVQEEANILIRKLGLPNFTTPMGKSAINEQLPNFYGMYCGAYSSAIVASAVENADLVIHIGPIKSDVNSAFFTAKFGNSKVVEIHGDKVVVNGKLFEDVSMRGIMDRLAVAVNVTPPSSSPRSFSSSSPITLAYISPTNAHPPSPPITPRPNLSHLAIETKEAIQTQILPLQPITHAHLWPRLSTWFRPHDVVVTENGTAAIGIWESVFPPSVRHISQTLWGSIGYSVPAAQGAASALMDRGEVGARTVVFCGDGSFQLTVQELSTIMRYRLNVTLFLIENKGYTIERFIHGMEAEYNDIVDWRYEHLPFIFGAAGAMGVVGKGEEVVDTRVVETQDELELLLQDRNFAESEGVKFVVLRMGQFDAPKVLIELAKGAAGNNS